MINTVMEHRCNGLIAVMLVILIQHTKTSEAIQCYQCKVAAFVYSDDLPICKDFDYSEKFIVDCPYSTWCVKTNRYTKLNGKDVNGTERYCGQQREVSQILQDNKWHHQTLIREDYTEGCNITKDRIRTTVIEENCYCMGDLCNAGGSLNIKKTLWIFCIFSLWFTLTL